VKNNPKLMNIAFYKLLGYTQLIFLFIISELFPNELQEAYTLRYQGKFEEAIKKVKSSKFLGDTESEILLAKLYLDTGAFQDAIPLYVRLCKTINTHECFNELGISYMENSNFPLAIESFEKSLEINPQFATGYSNLAMCYTKSKDFSKAETSHLKALEIMPNNPIIRINYGVYLIKNKKYQRAKDILYPVIVENESMYYAELYIGVAHYFKEEFNSALIHYNRAIAINPEFPDLYYYRALLLYRKGEYNNSINDLKTLEKLNTTFSQQKVQELRKLIKLSGKI
jgi:tetratricopeptide (TPR) repeat protein